MNSQPLKGALGRVDKVVMAVARYLSYLGGIALVGIMIIAFVNVLGEKILVKGIPDAADMIKYLHMPVVFSGMAYVNLDTGHTRIDLLSKKFPPLVSKLIGALANLLGAFICGFIATRGAERLVTYFQRRMLSGVGSGLLLWPFALVLVVGFGLLAVTYLWSIVRQFGKREEIEEQGGEDQ